MSVSFDDSELRRFATDLGKVGVGMVKKVDPVVKKAAQNLKDAYTKQAKSTRHFNTAFASSFSYDSDYRLGAVQYEVGPDKDRAGGALGNIFFFGGSHGGGGSGDIDGPVEKETPVMEKYLLDLMEDEIK